MLQKRGPAGTPPQKNGGGGQGKNAKPAVFLCKTIARARFFRCGFFRSGFFPQPLFTAAAFYRARRPPPRSPFQAETHDRKK